MWQHLQGPRPDRWAGCKNRTQEIDSTDDQLQELGNYLAGAWGCFDEFNRITVEVLSVIAVQVKCIQDGIKEETPTFDFMGEVSPRACLLSCCAPSLTSSGDSHEPNCWLLHHYEPGLCWQSRAAGESQGKFTISSCLTIEVASVIELSEASGRVVAGLFIKFTLRPLIL